MEIKFIQLLPFYSQYTDDPEIVPMEIALWQSADNLCELEGCGRCDTGGDMFYSISEDPVGFYCPRHWYEMHLKSDSGYQLRDMTEGQFQQSLAYHGERLSKRSQLALNKLEEAVTLLNELGLVEKAAKVQETLKWIQPTESRKNDVKE